MGANTEPIFTLIPVIGVVSGSAANTDLSGSGTFMTVITGGTNGTRISKIVIQAIDTTTAGMVRLFIDDGVAVFLWKEVAVEAVTIAASTPAFSYEILLSSEEALILPSGYILKASTHNAEPFNIIAEGGDY